MDLDLDSIPPEHRARLLEQMPSLEVVPSPLIRVIGVGQVAQASGVTVELIAIEVRERGAILYWRAHSSTDLGWGQPMVELSDSHATDYRAGEGGWSGGGRQWEGQTAIVPAPPQGSVLTIVVPRFAAMMPMPGYTPLPPTEGPWRFVIEVDG